MKRTKKPTLRQLLDKAHEAFAKLLSDHIQLKGTVLKLQTANDTLIGENAAYKRLASEWKKKAEDAEAAQLQLYDDVFDVAQPFDSEKQREAEAEMDWAMGKG